MNGYSTAVSSADNSASNNNECEAALDDLPYEILQIIGEKLNAKEITSGLAQVDHRLDQIFGGESYWTERLRRDSEYYYKIVSQDITPAFREKNYLRHKLYYWEAINRNFRSKHLQEHYLGEETQQILGNFRCIEFANYGNALAYVIRDRHFVSVWNIGPVLASISTGQPELVQFADHDQKVSSLKANGNLLSSGAYDGTVVIRDLDHLVVTDPPFQRLFSAGLVQAHSWKRNNIATGTRGGTFEVFDVRAGDEPHLRDKVFLSTEICHDFQIILRENDAILAGWDNGVRKLKLFDLRNGQIMVDNEAGTWNLTMSYGDNQLWIGADKGKVLQYDPDSLELVKDWTRSFGHLTNIGWLPHASFWECVRSIVYNHGHVFTADMRQLKLHELDTTSPRLMWEEEIVFSELAFCEERLLLAAAVGHTPDQIKLIYPSLQ